MKTEGEKLLLCTDLDRTLLPNGPQPESPQARTLFSKLCCHPGVTLVFVTGRHRELVQEAIDTYSLPMPQYVIADVGSTIYQITDHNWSPSDSWSRHISPDWAGQDREKLHSLIEDIPELRLQEPGKQGLYKLSYYVPVNATGPALIKRIQSRFAEQEICANLIWSIDEPADTGLLDVLPRSASKRLAIEFLADNQGFALEEIVFAGDSGNDISVMASEIPSVLVSNAAQEIKQQALESARQQGQADRLYIASGLFQGMNGNFSAGILEGVCHYRPFYNNWLVQQTT